MRVRTSVCPVEVLPVSTPCFLPYYWPQGQAAEYIHSDPKEIGYTI